MDRDPQNVLQQFYLAKLKHVDNITQKWPRLYYAMVHHLNIRGERMRFDDKPYLVALYKDDAQEISVKSSVQTGKSELAIISALAHAERGLQVMYVLPTAELRNQFVANRVDKLFERVPHYMKMLHRATNVAASRGLKHFGDGTIFFSGSNSATTFIEKPLDMVIADELDRFDLHNYEKADDRMTASPHKLKLEVSNPTVDNYGIDRRYRSSDQRELYVKCEHCQKWQTLDWFKNVVSQTNDNDFRLLDKDWHEGDDRDIHMLCIKCSKPLQRFTHQATWVPKYPSRKQHHGYHIHQMMSSYVRIDSMWRKFCEGMGDDTAMQVFYNSALGLTFAGAGSKINDDMLNACKEDYTMPATSQHPCVMGVDVGKRLNVVVREILPGEKFRLVFAGTLREFEDLDHLFSRFNIVGYVIDAMPETRKSIEWAKKKPGRGWMCRYNQGLTEVGQNVDDRIVTADRTMLMDRVLKFYRNRNYVNPRNAQSLDNGDYYYQIKTPTRVFNAEKDRYDWLGDPDHYFHAEVYAVLAYICRGEFRVVGIPVANNSFGAPVGPPPANFGDLPLPPNAPQALVEHYRRLYDRAKGGNG